MECDTSILSTLTVVKRMAMAAGTVLMLIVCGTPPAPALDFWDLALVDDGADSSLAILPSGRPAVSYQGAYPLHNLCYAWYDGSGWHTTVVDASGSCNDTSLAILPSGDPAIAYRLSPSEQLKYAWYDGGSWQTVVVDSVGNYGGTPSLGVLSSGQPAIAYFANTSSGQIKYAWYDGDAWQTTVVDDVGVAYGNPSLAILPSGHPALSYYHYYPERDLKYAWYDGNVWHKETVASAGSVGRYNSLAILPSGHPAISYSDYTAYALKYTWHDGSGWQVITVCSDSPGTGNRLAILPSGQPAISHIEPPAHVLNYACYDGSIWSRSTVDFPVSSVGSPSLAILPSGRAAISYSALDAGDLKFAAAADLAPAAVTMTTDYTATAWTYWGGTTIVENGPASSIGCFGDWEPGFVQSSARLEGTESGHLCGSAEITGRDGADCLDWDPFDPWHCWSWQGVSWGDASGTVSGTLELGTSEDYPAGTELELALAVQVRGVAADAEGYYSKLWRDDSLIAEIDPDVPDEIIVAAEAGETLTFEMFALEEDWYGDYSEHHRAFEFRFILRAPPCPGDLDADGDTDQADLGILLADWGCDDPVNGCPGDLDYDGDTDQADLGILLADWGCTPWSGQRSREGEAPAEPRLGCAACSSAAPRATGGLPTSALSQSPSPFRIRHFAPNPANPHQLKTEH